MSAPLISVVIPARDAAQTLGDTLAGLSAQRVREPFEVILVDDGSTDCTAHLAACSPVVNRVLQCAGVGPGAARNAGAAAARADRLAFLDADCRPAPGWLQAGSSALATADLVLGEVRPRPDQLLGPFDRTLAVRATSPLFESANLFVRTELFARLGGFEAWLSPRNGKELGEDLWFGWRARRSGARIAACPQALVHHEIFPRGPAAFLAERWRLRFFPALTRRVPELRTEAFYGRFFLNRRTASFDAALLGLMLARPPRRRACALAAMPYARYLSQDLRERDGLSKVGVRVAADAVGLAAMLLGSARHRSVLL